LLATRAHQHPFEQLLAHARALPVAVIAMVAVVTGGGHHRLAGSRRASAGALWSSVSLSAGESRAIRPKTSVNGTYGKESPAKSGSGRP